MDNMGIMAEEEEKGKKEEEEEEECKYVVFAMYHGTLLRGYISQICMLNHC